MQRFTIPRVAQASPGPVRRPTKPTDKLSRRRAGLLVLLAVTSAIALTGAGTAGAVGKYPDAAGDGKGSADLTGVSILSDTVGQIVFTVATAADPLAGEGWTVLFLDTDANPDTGAFGMLGTLSSRLARSVPQEGTVLEGPHPPGEVREASRVAIVRETCPPHARAPSPQLCQLVREAGYVWRGGNGREKGHAEDRHGAWYRGCGRHPARGLWP